MLGRRAPGELLQRIQLRVPIELREIPTGTKVLDWEVPKEWNIRAARIERLDGTPVIDFADCNLHVVNYSGPVDAIVSRELLAEHVHTLPDRPEWIPYRTGYYTEDWGFCLQSSIWEQMKDTEYRVFIDSSLETGALSYGEIMIPGRQTDEVLLSVHCCHPSLANVQSLRDCGRGRADPSPSRPY